MRMKWGIIAGVLGGIAAAEAGGSAYFYRRTMMRYNAKKERTMKMSGVDWESYYSFMKPRGEWMRAQTHDQNRDDKDAGWIQWSVLLRSSHGG